MNKLLRCIVYTIAPVESRCSLNDLLTQVNHTAEMIRQTPSQTILMLLDSKIEQIATYYRHVRQTRHWVNYLCDKMHVRRCELVGMQPIENEVD